MRKQRFLGKYQKFFNAQHDIINMKMVKERYIYPFPLKGYFIRSILYLNFLKFRFMIINNIDEKWGIRDLPKTFMGTGLQRFLHQKFTLNIGEYPNLLKMAKVRKDNFKEEFYVKQKF